MNRTNCAGHKPKRTGDPVFFGFFLLLSSRFCNRANGTYYNRRISMAHKQPKTGIMEEELDLFMEELFRLRQDYEQCEDEIYQKELQADIEVLLVVINRMQRM